MFKSNHSLVLINEATSSRRPLAVPCDRPCNIESYNDIALASRIKNGMAGWRDARIIGVASMRR